MCNFAKLNANFVDIDLNSQNILYEDLKKATRNTKAIILVHLAGYPCDMDKIVKICKKFKIKIIGIVHKHMVQSIIEICWFFWRHSYLSFCNDKLCLQAVREECF